MTNMHHEFVPYLDVIYVRNSNQFNLFVLPHFSYDFVLHILGYIEVTCLISYFLNECFL